MIIYYWRSKQDPEQDLMPMKGAFRLCFIPVRLWNNANDNQQPAVLMSVRFELVALSPSFQAMKLLQRLTYISGFCIWKFISFFWCIYGSKVLHLHKMQLNRKSFFVRSLKLWTWCSEIPFKLICNAVVFGSALKRLLISKVSSSLRPLMNIHSESKWVKLWESWTVWTAESADMCVTEY